MRLPGEFAFLGWGGGGAPLKHFNTFVIVYFNATRNTLWAMYINLILHENNKKYSLFMMEQWALGGLKSLDV